MSITFNQFLSRVDEGLSQYGSNRGVQLTPRQRAAVPLRIQRRDRNKDSEIWRAPGTEPNQTTPKPSGGGVTFFDDRSNNPPKVVVQPTPPKVELGLRNLGKEGKNTRLTYNATMRRHGHFPTSRSGERLYGASYNSTVRKNRKEALKEFINLYRQSIINS